MPPFDQMGGSGSVDTENLSLEHRTQVTGRELQELLSVSHQSIDEAQERCVLVFYIFTAIFSFYYSLLNYSPRLNFRAYFYS